MNRNDRKFYGLDSSDKQFFGFAILMWIVGIILNLLLWGGLIWFAFYLYSRYVG